MGWNVNKHSADITSADKSLKIRMPKKCQACLLDLVQSEILLLA